MESLLQLFVHVDDFCQTFLPQIDSLSLEVCINQRIVSHKGFTGLAGRGKTSTGWFFGFRLHLVINTRDELLNV